VTALAKTTLGNRRERGFILATVLVFLVVLSLVAFFAARLTRANTQVVNNLQNEKQAFFAAEAGIDEALYRLSLKSPSCVSMGIGPGISSGCTGSTFDASIAPRIASELARSNLGIVVHNPVDTVNDPLSTTQILLSTAVPSSSGNNLMTPSLQPAAVRLPYSTATGDSSPIDLTTGDIITTNLTVGWDVCAGPNTSTGCDNVPTSTTYNPYYPIRGLPISSPRPVVKIVSTGTVQRSNGDIVASRKVTAWATDCDKGTNNGSILTTGTACADGIGISGSATITTAGGIHVDAGAAGGGSCNNALSTGGSATITAGGDITSVGGVSGNATAYTPDPKPGSGYVADPYNDPPKPPLQPPCFPGRTSVCDSANTVNSVQYGLDSAPAKQTAGSNTVLHPGIYYGGINITGTNVTMLPGIYVMAGGGFNISTGSTQVTGTDVMIFNTNNPTCTGGLCDPDSVSIIGGNVGSSLTGRGAGESYDGFVVFQDRNPPMTSQPQISLQGGTTSTPLLDGIVYAPDANLLLYGNNTINMAGSLIVKSVSTNGSPSLAIGNSSNPGSACSGPLYSRRAWQDF
jgi:Tfp pilus assembly protein PilX